MSVGRKLIDLYDDGGSSTVFDWVHANRPEWDWERCEPCEEDTPSWVEGTDNICAVCFCGRGEKS